jgi:hypothetical protein
MLIGDKLDIMWKETVMAYFEVKSQHMHVGTKEDHEYAQVCEGRTISCSIIFVFEERVVIIYILLDYRYDALRTVERKVPSRVPSKYYKLMTS